MNTPALWRELDEYWFGELRDGYAAADRQRLWFGGGADVDGAIRARFGAAVETALAGGFRDWEGSARGELALVLLLDQFPRNIFRGSARAFAGDARARALVEAALAAGRDRELAPVERSFFYLPLEHAEDLTALERCVALYTDLRDSAPPARRAGAENNLDYARRHRDIIARFGRYPHRNAVLGRVSSAAEQAWLATGDHFGQ